MRNCECNGHGTCDESTAVCHYLGDECELCANDYYAAGSKCLLKCPCLPSSCKLSWTLLRQQRIPPNVLMKQATQQLEMLSVQHVLPDTLVTRIVPLPFAERLLGGFRAFETQTLVYLERGQCISDLHRTPLG
jgi:hypothetical protein